MNFGVMAKQRWVQSCHLQDHFFFFPFLFHFYWRGERECERAGTVFIIRQGTFRVQRSLCPVNVGMMGETHTRTHTLIQTHLTQPHRNMHKHQGNDRCLVRVVRVTVNNAEILALTLIVGTLLPSFLMTICHPSLQSFFIFKTSLHQFSHADFSILWHLHSDTFDFNIGFFFFFGFLLI